MEHREQAKLCKFTLDGRYALDNFGRVWDVIGVCQRPSQVSELLLITPADDYGWKVLDSNGRVGHVSILGEVTWAPIKVNTNYQGMAFIRDRKWILLYGGEHSGGWLHCIDAIDTTRRWEHPLRYGEMMSFALSPSGNQWLLGCNVYHNFVSMIDGDLILFFLLPEGKVGGKVTDAEQGVSALAWHPDGEHVVVGMFSGDLQWRHAQGRATFGVQPGHSYPIAKLCYTGDGKGVVSVGEDRYLKIRALTGPAGGPHPLVYAKALPSKVLDLVCPPRSNSLMIVDEVLEFQTYALPESLWHEAALPEEEMLPSHDRWIAAGDRLYTQIAGQTDAVLQDIGREIERQELEKMADDLAEQTEVVAIAREGERADRMREDGKKSEAIEIYVTLNDKIEQLWQSNRLSREVERKSLLHVQCRVTLFAGLEIMYAAGVDERMRPWQEIPAPNDQLFRALELLQQSERIDRSFAVPRECDENGWHIYVELGHLHHRLKNKEASIACYTKSLQGSTTAKQRAASFFGRAAVQFYSGEFGDSVEDYLAADAEGVEPHGVGAYNAACAYALIGQPDKAVEMLCRAEAKGYPSRAKADADEDFAAIRKAPMFTNFMRGRKGPDT